MHQQPTFVEKLKGLFVNQKKPYEAVDLGIVNEASFDVPMSQKAKFRDDDKLNKSMPGVRQKNQFSIDEDDLDDQDSNNPQKIVSQTQAKIPTPSQLVKPINLSFEGYEEIDIKPLSGSRMIEKEPLKEPYQKGTVMNFPPQSTFKIIKVPKVYDSIFDYLVGHVSREIIIDGGWLYIMKKQGNDKFKVCSSNRLDLLFKILIKKNDKKPLVKLAFINNRKNIYLMPRLKEFTLINKEQQDLFLIKLRSEVQKHGLDLALKK